MNENNETPYFYDAQTRSVILQFMQVFAWMSVNHGTRAEPEMVSVPVHYGLKDRVAAAVLANNTHNTVMRLPSIAVHLTNHELAPQHLKGYGIDGVAKEFPRGGVWPDDLRARISISPVPMYLTFTVSIMTTNTDERLQILEQLIVLFRNYQLQLQTSDSHVKTTRMVHVTWEGITDETPYPPGQERRVITQDLQFRVLVYYAAPSQVADTLVKQVKIRLAQIDTYDVSASEAVADIEGYVFDNMTLINTLGDTSD